MSKHDNTTQTWLNSIYLYEESLLFYTLINLGWYVIAVFTIGFYIPNFNDLENLYFNFVWCIILCIFLCFPNVFYKLFRHKKAYLFIEEKKIKEYLIKFHEPEKYNYIFNLLITQGKFPLNKKQQIALGFLFMVMIFDLFYSHVWVKDGILIWQPNWVVSCVEWVKNHLTPPNTHGYWNWKQWDIFSLYFSDDTLGQALKKEFGNEIQFLQNPISTSLLFYHFIRFVLFIPIITAFCIILWIPLKFMRNSNKDPSNIHGIIDFIRASTWSIVMIFFAIICSYSLIHNVEFYFNFIRTGENGKAIFGLYLFIAISVRFLTGWFVFFKISFQQVFKLGVNHE